MPSKAMLLSSGLQGPAASKLGFDPLTAFTAAGSSQATATSLTANFANVTTSAISSGVILTGPFDRTAVFNSGPNTLTIYPPVGGTIAGSAINVGFTLANGNGVVLEGDGLNYLASYSN